MTRRCAPATLSLRCAIVAFVALLIAACAENPQKPTGTVAQPASTAHTRQPRKPWKPLGPYTPGGLYAPGVADGAPEIPADVANLPEPVPHAEPLSRYGNRSPYQVLGKTYTVLPSAHGYFERGVASWYGTKFDGRATSNFEPYDMYEFTAAHRTLPLPSYARVTNLDNGRSVIVRINDRGPFHEGRLIDLSYAAAVKLGVNVHGTAPVEVRGIDPGQSPTVPAVAAQIMHGSGASQAGGGLNAVSQGSSSPVQTPVPQITAAPIAAGIAPAAVVTVPNATMAMPESTFVLPQQTAINPATEAPNRSSPTTSTAPAQTATTTQSAAAPAAVPTGGATPTVPQAQTATALSRTQANDVSPAAILNGQLPTDRPLIEPSTQGFLQVASYSDRSNAEHMLQRLLQAGVAHAELISVQVADQIMWRVHVGPMRSDEAEGIAQHLDALGFGYPPFFKE